MPLHGAFETPPREIAPGKSPYQVTVIAGSDGQATPVAIVLTAAEFTQLMEKITARQFDDAQTFTLQAIVEPQEDVRIVSVHILLEEAGSGAQPRGPERADCESGGRGRGDCQRARGAGS